MLSHIARVSGLCGDWRMLETVVVKYARRNRSHAEEGELDLSFLCTSLYALHMIAVRNLVEHCLRILSF